MTMTERKIRDFIFIGFALIVVAGCNSSTPSKTAEQFEKAMAANDYSKAKEYCTKETGETMDGLLAFVGDAKKAPPITSFTFTVVEEKITGDHAVVKFKSNNPHGGEEEDLVKIDGKWKVTMRKPDGTLK